MSFWDIYNSSLTEGNEDSLDVVNAGPEMEANLNGASLNQPPPFSMSPPPDFPIRPGNGSNAWEGVGFGVSQTPNSDLDPPLLSKPSCDCLHTAGGLMMELEAKGLTPDTAALDTKLASQKDFLNRCNTLLHCAACRTRPEYLLLLGLFTQNLTSLCEATVNSYLAEVQSISNSRGTWDTTSDSMSTAGTMARIGRYEIDSQQEWNTLVKVLIILQLQSIENLLRGTKEASYMESNSMLPRVQWPCE